VNPPAISRPPPITANPPTTVLPILFHIVAVDGGTDTPGTWLLGRGVLGQCIEAVEKDAGVAFVFGLILAKKS
jgi:hypothetical protein